MSSSKHAGVPPTVAHRKLKLVRWARFKLEKAERTHGKRSPQYYRAKGYLRKLENLNRKQLSAYRVGTL